MYSILVRMFCRYRQAELWEEPSISRSGGNPAARSALASAAPFCQCSCKKGLVTNTSQLCFAHLASSKSVSSSPTYQRRSVSIGSNTRKCLRGALVEFRYSPKQKSCFRACPIFGHQMTDIRNVSVEILAFWLVKLTSLVILGKPTCLETAW